jgi:hypothetical protein
LSGLTCAVASPAGRAVACRPAATMGGKGREGVREGGGGGGGRRRRGRPLVAVAGGGNVRGAAYIWSWPC